jgi:hypothetical protein
MTHDTPTPEPPPFTGVPPAWVDALLACRLTPLRPFDQGADGRVSIRVPRFDGRLLRRLLMPLLRRPDFGIRLDDLGSAAWMLCDGARTGEDIATLLVDRFPAQTDVRLRFAVFLKALVAQEHLRADMPA